MKSFNLYQLQKGMLKKQVFFKEYICKRAPRPRSADDHAVQEDGDFFFR